MVKQRHYIHTLPGASIYESSSCINLEALCCDVLHCPCHRNRANQVDCCIGDRKDRNSIAVWLIYFTSISTYPKFVLLFEREDRSDIEHILDMRTVTQTPQQPSYIGKLLHGLIYVCEVMLDSFTSDVHCYGYQDFSLSSAHQSPSPCPRRWHLSPSALTSGHWPTCKYDRHLEVKMIQVWNLCRQKSLLKQITFQKYTLS